MAKTCTVVAALVASAALCIAALASANHMYVEGKVYCDTCRVQFETPLSQHVEGATVTLLCRNRMTENVTVEIDAVTDKSGEYSIKVEGEHAGDICEVHLSKPGSGECNDGCGVERRKNFVDKRGWVGRACTPCKSSWFHDEERFG